MSDVPDRTVDVVLVGAGPVGLVLGILLAQRGRTVEIIEQWPNPYVLPRAVHFDHEVGRILQSCGIGDELRSFSEPAEIYEWQNASGTTLLRFGRTGIALSGWPVSSMFCQPDLEALLASRAASLPTLTVRRGTRLKGLDQQPDHVAMNVVPVATDGDGKLVEQTEAAETIRAKYVVGCDGANSTTRDLLGIDMDDRGFFYDWLIVDVVLNEDRVFTPANLQICDPARPTTAVSGGPGRRRWEFMRLPDEDPAALASESRAWELLAPWDVNPGNATLERHAIYTFQARVAQQWRSNRVLLAGDAAHQMPPFAGQGMCAGVRDAANLGWKLDLLLSGDAEPGLLDSYDQERRPSANAAVDFSIELGKVICVPDPVEAAARDEAMAAGFDGKVSEIPPMPGIAAGIVHEGAKLAGELIPQGEHDGQLFDDQFGNGFILFTSGSAASTEELDPQQVAWLNSIGGKVLSAEDLPKNLTDWFEQNDSTWALQRPDFYLFGTASDAAAASAMIADLQVRLR